MSIQIFEMSPRDGLQNESRKVTTSQKLTLIQGLYDAGLKEVEVGSFVRGDRVPQMADTAEVFEKTKMRKPWVLVPNQKGLTTALKSSCKKIAVFTAASDGFNKKNIGMSVAESLIEIRKVVGEAKNSGLKVRGYISTAFGCPFDGKVSPSAVLKVSEKLLDAGVDLLSIGDTIGIGTPKNVEAVFSLLENKLGPGVLSKVAFHGHDTRGMGVVNAYAAYQLGVRQFDSSAGGLGGCPFAPGATGNVATEDLLFLFHSLGIKSGVSLNKLCEVSLAFSTTIGRPIAGRYLQAFAKKRNSRS